MIFLADINYSMIEQRMCMDIGVCVPVFNVVPTNVCELISCPLQAGKNYQITEKIAIPEVYPDVSGIHC